MTEPPEKKMEEIFQQNKFLGSTVIALSSHDMGCLANLLLDIVNCLSTLHLPKCILRTSVNIYADDEIEINRLRMRDLKID